MSNWDTAYGGKKDSLRLYISATASANVTVAIPLQSYAKSIVVPKDSVVVFLVPLHLGYISEYEKKLGKAIHITSDFPVSISAMNLLYATTDASIVLPYANIPRSTMYISGNPSTGFSSQILLVAGEDSTKVEVIPTANTKTGFPKNTPFNITLNKGEVYQIGGVADLSGSVVKVLSKSKLVVFTGDRCSAWPCGACDHQFEQILPNDVLDTAYCIPSHFGHTKGYLIKMVPLDTNTDITVNGFTYRNISRLNPLVIDVKGDSGYYASSKKLFHCHQFLKGAGCSGYINSSFGDPSQLEMLSTKHFGESSLFSTVNSFNLKDHFVNIVIKTSAKNNVYLDKTKIDSSEFIAFRHAKNYAFAKLKINTGQHLIECADGLLAYCYGVGFYESYLYLAGFSLPNFDLDFKDSVVVYNCKDKKITMQFTAKSDKKLKKYTWTFGDNTTGTGNPIQHLYNNTGIYTVKLVGEDFNGKKDSITRKINVTWPNFDPVRNKIICGIDTVTFIEKNPFFSNFKWHDNSTQNYYKSWTNEKVRVIATDTSGYCKFSDSGNVAKTDIFSNIKVDSLEKCWKYNKFSFQDSTKVFADDILHKAWVFPWTTVWDTSKTTIRFPMPGKYKVYFDIYTTKENCKARYPIDVVVHPMPKVFPKVKGELFCQNTPILFYDSSQIVTGKIKKIKLDFDDATSVESDSLKLYKELSYVTGVLRFYDHIAISDMNCSDTVLNAVEVWPKPKTDFTLDISDTIQCLTNARWTYTSTTTIDADTMNLYWNAGNGRTSTNSSMKNIRYFNPGKYKVKLTAVSTFGCIDSMVKNIEVVELPKARININDSTQCFSWHSFNFRDTSVGKYLNHSWKLGEGMISLKPTVDSVRYTANGLHTVQLKVSSPYPGCEDSIARDIFIYKDPKAQLTVDNDTQCLSGNKFNIQNSSVFYQSYKSTNWTSNAYADTNFNLTNFSLSDTGNHILRLVVNDMEGCADTAFTTLNITPQPTTLLTINDSIQCFSKNAFIFSTNNINNGVNTWKVNNKEVYSGREDSLVYSEPKTGMHTISLLKETFNGCRDSISRKYRLLEAPDAAFYVNKDSQCFVDNNFNFSDASMATNDIITEWSYRIENLDYSGQNISNISFLNVGTKKATLYIKTKEECIDSFSINLTVLPNPHARITGDSVCLHKEAIISGNQISGAPITEWNWDLGDGNTMNAQSGKHLYANPVAYHLQLMIKDINGCSETVHSNNAVIIYPLPDATFYAYESDYGVNQVLMRFNPVLVNGNQYLWQFPDGTFSMSDTPSVLVTKLLKGDIQLKVTSEHGCTDSTAQSYYVYPENFNVYIPNAISLNGDEINDVFKIEGLTNAQDYNFQILNRWGEVLFFSDDPTIGWDGSYKGEMVQDGVYLYDISFRYFDGKHYRFKGTLTVLK